MELEKYEHNWFTNIIFSSLSRAHTRIMSLKHERYPTLPTMHIFSFMIHIALHSLNTQKNETLYVASCNGFWEDLGMFYFICLLSLE